MTDDEIRQRFDDLLAQADEIASQSRTERRRIEVKGRPPSNFPAAEVVDKTAFEQWLASALALVGNACGKDSVFYVRLNELRPISGNVAKSVLALCRANLAAAKDDYARGLAGSSGSEVDAGSLRQKIENLFSREEIKTLCFDLGVDYDNLPGDTKGAMSRELVIFAQRNNLLSELKEQLRVKRPKVNWP